MSITLTIAGVSKEMRQWGFDLTVNGRDRAQFDTWSIAAAYRPALGAEVIIADGATTIFGGYITSLTELGVELGADIISRVTALDYNALVDRRVVNGVFPTGTLKSMLQLIISSYLTGYSVTLDPSQENGPTIAALTLPGIPLGTVLDQLSTQSGGYIWRIDTNKVLSLRPIGSFVAPFNINTATDTNTVGDVIVDTTRTGSLRYANRVFVAAGGSGAQEVRGELHYGNGVTRTFALDVTCLRQPPYAAVAITSSAIGNPCVLLMGAAHEFVTGDSAVVAGHAGSTPAIDGTYTVSVVDATHVSIPINVTVAGTGGTATAVPVVKSVQTNRSGVLAPFPVGVYGVDAMAWTFEAATNSLRQAVSETLLAAADYVDVNYIGTFPFVVQVDNTSEQAPPTGLWEASVTIPNMLRADAVAYGARYIAQSILSPKRVVYTTRRSGLMAGMTQILQIPTRNVNTTFLIQSLRVSANTDNVVEYVVTCVEGSVYQSSWRDLYRGWGQGGGGASSASGGGAAAAGASGGTSSGRLSYFLGGSLSEYVQSVTPTWVAASAVQILLDTVALGTQSGTVYARLRAASGSVTARLRNVSDGITVGTSAVASSPSFSSVSFPVIFTPGSKIYALELLPSAADIDVSGVGYIDL